MDKTRRRKKNNGAHFYSVTEREVTEMTSKPPPLLNGELDFFSTANSLLLSGDCDFFFRAFCCRAFRFFSTARFLLLNGKLFNFVCEQFLLLIDERTGKGRSKNGRERVKGNFGPLPQNKVMTVVNVKSIYELKNFSYGLRP